MVNCGLSHKLHCVNSSQPIILSQTGPKLIQFQRATVLGFTRAENAPVVPTNIFVSNARGLIPSQNVIFVTSANPPVLSPKLPIPFPISLPTPVKVEWLAFLLDGYNPSTVQYLLSGFTQGFPVHFQGDHQSFFATNLLSAVENPLVVDAKLQKELDTHRLAGPFQFPHFPHFGFHLSA